MKHHPDFGTVPSRRLYLLPKNFAWMLLEAQVAPIPWSHIGITGDYLWNEIDHPLERFRPLRTNHFKPKAFVSLSGYYGTKDLGAPA